MLNLGEKIIKYFKILQRDGFILFIKRSVVFIWRKITNAINFSEVNSKKYWDFRLKYNWLFVGGGEQNTYFAVGAFANINKDNFRSVNTILDFGCANGDAAPVLNIFFPKAKIYLHDLSNSGVNNGLKRFSRSIPVYKWEQSIGKVDLVYCSNVIEHVDDPRSFVDELLEASQKYVLIQAPWEERGLDGRLIDPSSPHGEHVWTLNDDFFKKYIERENVVWKKYLGNIELSWPGGEQVFYLGEKVI